MIIALLFILLYALVAVLVLELIFWIIGLFIAVPPKMRQLAYAIVGVLFLIWILQLVLAGGFHPPPLPMR